MNLSVVIKTTSYILGWKFIYRRSVFEINSGNGVFSYLKEIFIEIEENQML